MYLMLIFDTFEVFAIIIIIELVHKTVISFLSK